MGFFRNRDLSTTPTTPDSSLGRGDVIPANGGSMTDRLRAGGGQLVDSATGCGSPPTTRLSAHRTSPRLDWLRCCAAFSMGPMRIFV